MTHAQNVSHAAIESLLRVAMRLLPLLPLVLLYVSSLALAANSALLEIEIAGPQGPPFNMSAPTLFGYLSDALLTQANVSLPSPHMRDLAFLISVTRDQ